MQLVFERQPFCPPHRTDTGNYSDKAVKLLREKSKEENCYEEFDDFCVRQYTESGSFEVARRRFASYIAPRINEFEEKMIIALLAGMETNRQTTDRRGARDDHPEIYERAKSLDVWLGEYPNFIASLPKDLAKQANDQLPF